MSGHEKVTSQIICILGMHRSGTSLTTRILNLLGVDLGPEKHLMKPCEDDNPKGFWEHRLLVDLNDAILSRLGGSWHEPPIFPSRWDISPQLADLRQLAQAILQKDFDSAELWGWKDPRTCLTLPFWQRILPPMKYVICLRNPVDVAKSLERRDKFPLEKGVRLWLTYVSSALEHTQDQPRLLVFYEDVMENWRRELKRLAQFIGKPELAEEVTVQSAVGEFVTNELYHHRTSLLEVLDTPDLAFTAKALYLSLRLLVKLHQADESSQGDQALQKALYQLSVYAVKAQNQTVEREQLLQKALQIAPLKSPLREREIRKVQKSLLKQMYSPTARRLIIFLTPGWDTITGGVLSILSIYKETIKLKHIHRAETILCSVPGDPLLLRYTKLQDNDYCIYELSEVMSYFRNVENLLIHIPAYAISQFLFKCQAIDLIRITQISNVRINILLQNIDLIMPNLKYLPELKMLGKLTCTTAHEAYSTLKVANMLGCRLYKLGVYVSPEQYRRTRYSEKENIMIVSPDMHPRKSEIMKLLRDHFPSLGIRIIKDLTYEQYKQLISRAKWALTFGEGLDGYFVETVFSGGISFAVYNNRFFTKDFLGLRTVYPSYEVMAQKITSDLAELDNEKNYTSYQSAQWSMCASYYNYATYVKRLAWFYTQNFRPKGSEI
ncbi:MAG: sulfotransferase domain-containing protein [Deltaproteobacteria bacterium]|nr:sulfotransferase domain-containing protein [Deltaproteobacteria bacterium]MBW2068415.1 sulfotransferase domain-containing protein [Deltaproteobacteria bacterium]